MQQAASHKAPFHHRKELITMIPEFMGMSTNFLRSPHTRSQHLRALHTRALMIIFLDCVGHTGMRGLSHALKAVGE
jgi:hypothetical protein